MQPAALHYGTQVPDENGDEEDGMDESICTVVGLCTLNQVDP
jgi:hypothetical protein